MIDIDFPDVGDAGGPGGGLPPEVIKSILRWLLLAVVFIAIIAAFVFADLIGGSTWDGHFRVHIHGRVVDWATHDPVAGAWVMTMHREDADNPAEIAEWEQELGDEGEPFSIYSRVKTGPDGSFVLPVDLPWGAQQGCTGIPYGKQAPPPFYGLSICVVKADGFQRTVHDVTKGTWEDGGDDGLFGRIHLKKLTIRRKR